jgi:exosortase
MSQTLSLPLESQRPARPVKGVVPIPLAVVAVVLVLAHLPLLVAHMHVLGLKPHYEFTPLVFVGAAVLAWHGQIWQLLKAGHRPGPRGWWTGMALLGLNWVMLTIAVVFDSPWLGMVSFWELLVAVALLAGGWTVLRAAVPALIFLLLIVPPPMNLDGKLVLTLQNKTSWVSGHILDRVGVLHFRDGNAFDTGSRQYGVERACSGINSLFSALAVTLFCVLYFGAHWLRTILLFVSLVVWVMVANITRVTLIVWLDNRFGIDLTKDTWDWSKRSFYQHQILGFVLFAMILGLLYSTNQLLKFLATTVRWGTAKVVHEDELPAPAENTPPWSWSWALLTPALAAYGALAIFQFGEIQLGALVSESELVKSYNTWTVEDMPEFIGPWTRQKDSKFDSRDSDNPFGAHSRTWQYKTNTGLVGLISFDYPFPEWHDLRGCYKSIGWAEEKSDAFTPKDGAGAGLECIRFELAKQFKKRGYCWFTEFDQTGRPIPIHKAEFVRTYTDMRWSERFMRMGERWRSLLHKGESPPSLVDVLQVQVLVENVGPLAPDRRTQAEQFFLQAADLVRAKCVAGSTGVNP